MGEKEQKKNIAVIGNTEFTLGFKLAGIQKVFDKKNYQNKIKQLTQREDIGILIVQKEDLEKLPSNTKQKIEASVDPVVVTLSEEAEATGLQDKIQKVIGIDLS